MASSIQVYNVSIANSNTNVTPSDGFVDSKKIENYATSLETTPSGLSIDLCLAKRRGNLRYTEIINQLSMVANCYVIPQSVDATGADDQTEASTFVFQMWTERGGVMITEDELNPGTMLTDEDAIARCVARALTADLFKQIDVVDPTSADTFGVPGSSTSVPRQWIRTLPDADNDILEVGSYESDLATAESFVTVTALL
jgi:hypothetical protein